MTRKKHICGAIFKAVVLIYVLGRIQSYIEENNTNPKITKKDKKNYKMFWIIEKEFQWYPHGPWKKGRIDLTLEKDHNKEGNKGKINTTKINEKECESIQGYSSKIGYKTCSFLTIEGN